MKNMTPSNMEVGNSIQASESSPGAHFTYLSSSAGIMPSGIPSKLQGLTYHVNKPQIILTVLQEAITNYNALVRKFDASGKQFIKRHDKKMYMHWRRGIREISGLLKPDITQIPARDFIVDKFLVYERELQGNNVVANSALPNPKIMSSLSKKGEKKILRKRVKAKARQDAEIIALERLRENAELKKRLFGDLATAHFKAKANCSTVEVKRIKKRILSRLKEFAAEI